MDDLAVISAQLGRPARAFRRVACRCPHGFPAVTEQAPYTADGTPFPTMYWLTCPWLVQAIDRIEAAGGVRRYSEAASADPRLARSLARANAEQRKLRPELDAGIGGSRRPGSVKCLHAHAAFALARPGYLLGERILAELELPWPERCCTASTLEP